ncbi:MAG: dienelactone hydrolase family protein, partial [Alphaproteobacteria bacterium]
GYCVGGSIAWLAAHEQAFAAVVSYYGKDIVDFLNRKPACPIIQHFGSLDKLITADDEAKIKAAFPELGIFTYHASHGFDDVERGYPEATDEARKRSLAFLREHLG